MTDYDSPWKEMLDGYFPAFMAFFFPEAYRDIDWDRGYESLDKELQQIVRDAELGKRLADKLMKVWRLSGEEQMVLIHTEVEGNPKEGFGKRMYSVANSYPYISKKLIVLPVVIVLPNISLIPN
jgi:hypothetical protein